MDEGVIIAPFRTLLVIRDTGSTEYRVVAATRLSMVLCEERVCGHQAWMMEADVNLWT